MSQKDVFVVAATRTAIGSFGGSLKDMPPRHHGLHVLADSLHEAGCTVVPCVKMAVSHPCARLYLFRTSEWNELEKGFKE